MQMTLYVSRQHLTSNRLWIVLVAFHLLLASASATADAGTEVQCLAPADCASGLFCVSGRCRSRTSFVENWGGGDLGAGGVALAVTANGERLIAAVAGRELRLYRQPPEAVNWIQESIDPFAAAPQLEVDRDGRIHIAYRESGADQIKYARRTDSGWAIETIDRGASPALALGPDGRPYLAYSVAVGVGTVNKIAERRNGTWSMTEIASGGGLCPCIGDPTALCPCGAEPGRPLLRVGDDGRVHSVSPLWDTYPGLDYSVRTGDTWSSEAIETSGFLDGSTALALGAHGDVHVAYAKLGDILRVATRVDDTWSYVDTALPTGGHNALVADELGLHLCGFSPSQNPTELYYATNVSGAWQQTLVDAQAEKAGFCDLALDAAGQVHIAYASGETGALRIADNRSGVFESTTVAEGLIYTGRLGYRVDANGSGHLAAPRRAFRRELGRAWNHGHQADYWTDISGPPERSVVSGEALIFPGIAMALDRHGFSHLSYRQGWTVPDGAVYATNARLGDDGDWFREVVVAHYDIGGTAIATAGNGRPRIAYADGSDHSIKIAGFDGAEWQHTLVEARWAGNPNLIVDAMDDNHLLYNDGGGVFYATDAFGAWAVERLSDAPVNFLPTSLTISPQGVLHAVYWRSGEGLWYADTASGVWRSEPIENRQNVRQDVVLRGWNSFALTIDTEERPHVVFVNSENQLVHLRRSDDGWEAGVYDHAERNIEGIATDLDPDGALHIAYISDTALYRVVLPLLPQASTCSVETIRLTNAVTTGIQGYHSETGIQVTGQARVDQGARLNLRAPRIRFEPGFRVAGGGGLRATSMAVICHGDERAIPDLVTGTAQPAVTGSH